MSVEAMSWALNLAPVPRDQDGKGKRNAACKAVLVGLANHAGLDGRDAFPSVRTLVRYTDLSERTVRTALDRLEEAGIISPCDPAVVAAKIKRNGYRPQGWDLHMSLVRDDLDDEDLAVLAGHYPGLAARVTAMRVSASGPREPADLSREPGTCGEQRKPEPGDRSAGPVDNLAVGVQQLHPSPELG